MVSSKPLDRSSLLRLVGFKEAQSHRPLMAITSAIHCFIYISVYLSVCPSVVCRRSVCLSVRWLAGSLSVCLSVCLPFCLSLELSNIHGQPTTWLKTICLDKAARRSCSRKLARLPGILIHFTVFPFTLSTKLLEETVQEN